MRMYRSMAVVAAIALLAGLAGCSLNRQAEKEIWTALDEAHPATQKQIVAYATVPQPAATQPVATQPAHPRTARPAAAQPMEVPATLREYLTNAMAHNPDIERAAQIARAKAARVPQATALDDPLLTTRTLPAPIQTAAGNNYFNLGLMQKLPVPEKLDRRGRIALEEMRAALEDYRQVRQRVIGDVKRAWFRLYIIDRSVVVLQQNMDILRSLVDVVRSQVETGQRSQADLLRTYVELSDIDAQIIDLRQQRIAAAASINALLNRDPTAAVPSPAPFGIRQTDLAIDDLFAVAGKANPQLAMLRHQVERDRQAVRLAKLAYWPDFNIGFDWMYIQKRQVPSTATQPAYTNGEDSVAILFSFNLPIWSQKIQGGIREARHQLTAAQMQYDASRNSLYSMIQDALSRVRSQQELAHSLRARSSRRPARPTIPAWPAIVRGERISNISSPTGRSGCDSRSSITAPSANSNEASPTSNRPLEPVWRPSIVAGLATFLEVVEPTTVIPSFLSRDSVSQQPGPGV